MKQPSAFEHLLYLLSELERLVDRHDIQLPASQTETIRHRLAPIALKVAQAAQRGTHEPPTR